MSGLDLGARSSTLEFVNWSAELKTEGLSTPRDWQLLKSYSKFFCSVFASDKLKRTDSAEDEM